MLSQPTRLQAKPTIHIWRHVKFYKMKYVNKLILGLNVYVKFLINLVDLDIHIDFMHGGRHIRIHWIYRFQMIFQMNGIKWIRGINPLIKKKIILPGTINIGVIKSQTKFIAKKKNFLENLPRQQQQRYLCIWIEEKLIIKLLTFHTTKNKTLFLAVLEKCYWIS